MKNSKFLKSRQQIYIEESNTFKGIKYVNLVLHILTLFLSILTISGVIIGFEHNVEMTFEIITMIFIVLIILSHFTNSLLQKKHVRHFLRDFWGCNKIIQYNIVPKKISLQDEWTSTIEEVHQYKLNVQSILMWDKSNPFNWKVVNQIKILDESNKVIIYDFHIDFIIVNIKEEYVQLQVVLNDGNEKSRNKAKKFTLYFYPKTHKAIWSGVMPNLPFYGEWVWDDKVCITTKHSELKKLRKSRN